MVDMAISKEILNQYISEKKEIEDLEKKIEYLEKRIPKLEKRIAEIEDGHTVKDKVRGGNGGLQSFVIEGIPFDEWNDKKAELEFKKKILKQRKETLQILKMQLLLHTKEVEKFICGINDSFTRRIVTMRVVDGMMWKDIADKIGGYNNENSVKKIYQRFVESKC